MIKVTLLEDSDVLLDNFKNKRKIVSAKTVNVDVMKHVKVRSTDVISQLKLNLDRYNYFSLKLDKSTDIVNTIQLAIF